MKSTAAHVKAPSVLICGNGHSMREIDFSRLPAELDIYRVNQFYNEPFYTVSKRVTRLFVAYTFKVNVKLYTIYQLKLRGEYDIEGLIMGASRPPDSCAIFNPPSAQNSEIFIDLWRHSANVTTLFDYVKFFPEIQDFLYYKMDCEFKCPTSGLNAIVCALAEKYQQIFVAGIDFYDLKDDEAQHPDYFFKIGKNNLALFSDFSSSADMTNPDFGHNIFIETEFLQLILSQAARQNTKIFTVCKTSPIAKILPLAPKISSHFTPDGSKKPENFINDFILPPNFINPMTNAPNSRRAFIVRHNLQDEVDFIRTTPYFRVFFWLRFLIFKTSSGISSFIKMHKNLMKNLLNIYKKVRRR